MNVKLFGRTFWIAMLASFLLLHLEVTQAANNQLVVQPGSTRLMQFARDQFQELSVAPACATMVRLRIVLITRRPQSVSLIEPTLTCKSPDSQQSAMRAAEISSVLKTDGSPSFWARPRRAVWGGAAK